MLCKFDSVAYCHVASVRVAINTFSLCNRPPTHTLEQLGTLCSLGKCCAATPTLPCRRHQMHILCMTIAMHMPISHKAELSTLLFGWAGSG